MPNVLVLLPLPLPAVYPSDATYPSATTYPSGTALSLTPAA